VTRPLVRSIRLDGFLSFAPGSEPIELRPLNVLIGPNGSGKSNFLEAAYLLAQLPHGDRFQAALRAGGGASEWVWKGADASTLELDLNGERGRRYQYKVTWAPRGPGAAQATFLDESFVELPTEGGSAMTYFRIDGRQVEVATQVIGPSGPEPYTTQAVDRQYFKDSTSILSQRNTPGAYPDNIWLAEQFARLAECREWTFGRAATPRTAQRTDMPSDWLLPDGSNLVMMLQELTHRGLIDKLNDQLRRFLPRAGRLTTRISGGVILPYLQEDGAREPIPATRLSDGTLRLIALLVTLLADPAPPLVCIEEPELGLHPDALSLVAELLVAASARTQLIVTTHSDALVSALTEHIESVLVCEHLGGTQLRRLSTDSLSHWLDKYRLGDLWRIGELGGNP
jgi:predicted ATPase